MSLSNKIFSMRNIKLSNITKAMSQLTYNPDIQKDEIVLKPLKYIQKVVHLPGFNGPIDVYKAFNHWFKVPDDKVSAIEEFMDIYHSIALLMDDISDSSSVRNGMPASQVIYSDAHTIHSAFYGFLSALQKITNLEPRTLNICVDAGLNFSRGQCFEYYWRDNFICPTEEDYLNMTRQKTSSFTVAAYKLYQLFSNYEVNCMKVAEDIGVYHQVLDDYRDMFITEISDKKSFCTDITEGKFTLSTIHALNHSDSAEEILNILKLRTQDLKLKKWFISLLQKAGSFEYTRNVLFKIESEIHDEVKRLGGNSELIAAIDNFGNWKKIDINQFYRVTPHNVDILI